MDDESVAPGGQIGESRPARPRSESVSLRALLFAGFGSIFVLWLLSAYLVSDRMIEADARSLTIRSRFLQNQEILESVRAETLQASVDVRDALLDADADQTAAAEDKLQQIRASFDRELVNYQPWANSSAERDDWRQVQTDVNRYWTAVQTSLPPDHVLTADQARAALRDDILPRRDRVVRIVDQVRALNQIAFDAEQTELADLRNGLRRRVWLTSLVAVALGLAIAVMAARGVRRLDAHIREQHAHEVEQKQELAHLSAQLLLAQETERRRIARELHDEIGQALSALKLELVVASKHAPALAEGDTLTEARAITDRALQSVRDMSQLLHPSMLDDLGLPDTADWYLRGFSRRTGIASELSIERLTERLAPELEVCTYRVIQEAITNIARHADATSCRVQIARDSAALRIVVEDNGKGFEPESMPSADGRGLGLIGVRERVASLGGRLRVDSHPGAGTRLTVELPLAV